MEKKRCKVFHFPVDEKNVKTWSFYRLNISDDGYLNRLGKGVPQHLYVVHTQPLVIGDLYSIYQTGIGGMKRGWVKPKRFTGDPDELMKYNMIANGTKGVVVASTASVGVPNVSDKMIFNYVHSRFSEVYVENEINQCDGCSSGAPLYGRIHKDGSDRFGIACTAHLYTNHLLDSEGNIKYTEATITEKLAQMKRESFEGWSEEDKKSYLTAVVTLEEWIKEGYY